MEYLPLDVVKNQETLFHELLGRTLNWNDVYKDQKDWVINLLNRYMEKDQLPEAYALSDTDFPSDMVSYMKYVRSMSFLKDDDTNALAEKFKIHIPEIMNIGKLSVSSVMKNPKIDVRTDLRALVSSFCTMQNWVKNKQVLKPDDTFIYHLVQTDKLKVSKTMFDHLPYNAFYIDLSDCKKDNLFNGIKGVFVDILKISDEEYSIYSCYVLNEEYYCPQYLALKFQDDKEIEMPVTMFHEQETLRILMNTDSLSPQNLPARILKTLVLQLVCYMNVAAPDIEPNPSMKHTYHPNQTVKNKYREVFINDVGIRTGKKICDKEKAVIDAYKQSEDYKNTNPKVRKSPKAHFRSAHWHRYWTGQGRTELTVKWIEPVFVCGNISSDVIIHDVE